MTLSRQANRDLIDLWVHGAREWGADQANVYYDKIDDALHLLVAYPEIGTLRFNGNRQIGGGLSAATRSILDFVEMRCLSSASFTPRWTSLVI